MDFHVCVDDRCRRGGAKEARVLPFPRVYAVDCLVQGEESSDGQEDQGQRAGQGVGSAWGAGLGASSRAGAGWARGGGCTIVSACSLLPS